MFLKGYEISQKDRVNGEAVPMFFLDDLKLIFAQNIEGFVAINSNLSHTNSYSKIAPASGYPGDKEEATEAYNLVRRLDNDEVNKVI